MDLKEDFRLTSVSRPIVRTLPPLVNPLFPIDILIGKWVGTGFNQIWRPFFGTPPTQDHFLELNETIETLEFAAITGEIPNRGLLQTDMNMHGLTYLQQIQDANALAADGSRLPGIHLESGMWLTVPSTSNPNSPATVARMSNIPHGTAFVAQGSALPLSATPIFAVADITPFLIGRPQELIRFPESNLATSTTFRTAVTDIPHVTQQMVDNPNSLLASAIHGQNITSTTAFKISTVAPNPPPSGGGTSNISFLQGAGTGPNAQSAEVDATFWVETVLGPHGSRKTLLQYSQRVLLNFNGLSWPHISVATLVKQQ